MGVSKPESTAALPAYEEALNRRFSDSWAGRLGRLMGPFSVLLGMWCVVGASSPWLTAGLVVAYIAGNLAINRLNSERRFLIRTVWNTVLYVALSLTEASLERVWILALPLMVGSSFAYRRSHAFWMRFLPFIGLLGGSVYSGALESNHIISLSLILLMMSYVSEKLHLALRESTVNEQLKAAELQHVNAELASALATRQVFLATISHEVRTPLHGLLGMAELLEKTPLNDEQKRLLTIIQRSGDGLGLLISDVLDIAKLDSGQMVPRNDHYAPHDVVLEIIALIDAAHAAKSITFQVEHSDTAPKLVQGDSLRVRQILLNLVGNAAKFIDSGTITVSLDWSEGRQKFCVRDTGPGIAPSVLPMLFQPFQHFDTVDATGPQDGSGLGLSICKRLVECMGGKIGVESTLGEGALFHFWVDAPVSPAPTSQSTHPLEGSDPAQGPEGPQNAEKPWAGARVLLVDDNPVNRTVGRLMLSHLDCEVTGAASGREALIALDEGTFDLVLMDCRMPEMDGYETTAHIVQRDHPPPVVALTASVTVQERDRCTRSGMVDFIEKPADVTRLSETLQRWVVDVHQEANTTTEARKQDEPTA